MSVLGRLIARCLTAIAAGLFLVSAALLLFLLPPITHLFLDIAGSAHYLGVSPRDAVTALMTRGAKGEQG